MEGKVAIKKGIDRRDLTTLWSDIVLQSFGDERHTLELGIADGEQEHVGVFAAIDRQVAKGRYAIAQ